MMVFMILVVVLIGQFCRDVIGCQSDRPPKTIDGSKVIAKQQVINCCNFFVLTTNHITKKTDQSNLVVA